MTTAEANLRSAQLLIESLSRWGVDYFVLCPGSRSSPLAVALALTQERQVVHYDERGGAYHAVGHIRATGRPAAVITTSGTAAANLFPAVVEASLDHLPLIAVTADRPPELQNCGANQTIDQTRLFGDFARTFIDLSCPDGTDESDAFVPMLMNSLEAAFDREAGPGPVHVNCRYRKPLVPGPESTEPLNPADPSLPPEVSANVWGTGRETPDEVVDTVARTLKSARAGLLVVGRLETDHDRQAALDLSRALGWPTVADITSGLRFTRDLNLIDYYDLLLSSNSFSESHRVDTVLHVGGQVVSQHLLDFVRDSSPRAYIRNSADHKVFDPEQTVTEPLFYDNRSFCARLAERMENSGEVVESWTKANEQVASVLEQAIDTHDVLTEPVVARKIGRALDADHALFVASSMPIRDLNAFVSTDAGVVPVGANRGVSGIDGTLASAAGFAIGLDRPTTLLIGDQGFLHDLNSLSLAKTAQSLTIVLVNNGGGRIFEQLPIAEHGKLVDTHFAAAHTLTFEKIADMYGINYELTTTPEQFDDAYGRALSANRTTIIEASVDPRASREHHRDILRTVRAALERE